MIKKNRKKEYFTDVSNSLRTNPCSFWTERSSIIPKTNVKSIPRNTSREDFNIYFKSVPDLMFFIYREPLIIVEGTGKYIYV